MHRGRLRNGDQTTTTRHHQEVRLAHTPLPSRSLKTRVGTSSNAAATTPLPCLAGNARREKNGDDKTGPNNAWFGHPLGHGFFFFLFFFSFVYFIITHDFFHFKVLIMNPQWQQHRRKGWQRRIGSMGGKPSFGLNFQLLNHFFPTFNYFFFFFCSFTLLSFTFTY